MTAKNTRPSLYNSAVRFVHAALARRTRCSRRPRHWFGPGQASPALCPCEPRRSPGVKQSVDLWCSFRHPAVDVLRWERRSPQFRTVRKYNTRLGVQLKPKRSLYDTSRIFGFIPQAIFGFIPQAKEAAAIMHAASLCCLFCFCILYAWYRCCTAAVVVCTVATRLLLKFRRSVCVCVFYRPIVLPQHYLHRS